MKIIFKGWLYKMLKEKFRTKTNEELEEELKILKEKKAEADHRKELIKEISELRKNNIGMGIKFNWKAFNESMNKIGRFGEGLGEGLDMVLLGKKPEKKVNNN